MANVEHSVLTGTDLHESKGVAAAANNRVYVTNGAGSGSFQQVPAAAIASAGVLVFQSQKYHIRDEVSSGTASQGALTDNTWNTRRLQTEKTDDLTITLSGNQFALPAGTYWVEGFTSCFVTQDGGAAGVADGEASLRLRNISDSTTALSGIVYRQKFDSSSAGISYVQALLQIRGQFTIAGTKTFELQNWVKDASNGTTFNAGFSASSGENEVYADLVIWKLS
jgi:hypothetical protein